jgi:hypothetical protein
VSPSRRFPHCDGSWTTGKLTGRSTPRPSREPGAGESSRSCRKRPPWAIAPGRESRRRWVPRTWRCARRPRRAWRSCRKRPRPRSGRAASGTGVRVCGRRPSARFLSTPQAARRFWRCSRIRTPARSAVIDRLAEARTQRSFRVAARSKRPETT